MKHYALCIHDKWVQVQRNTTYPVVKWLTDDEFNKAIQIAGNQWVVRESLTLLSGEKIIVNYIRKAR